MCNWSKWTKEQIFYQHRCMCWLSAHTKGHYWYPRRHWNWYFLFEKTFDIPIIHWKRISLLHRKKISQNESISLNVVSAINDNRYWHNFDFVVIVMYKQSCICFIKKTITFVWMVPISIDIILQPVFFSFLFYPIFVDTVDMKPRFVSLQSLILLIDSFYLFVFFNILAAVWKQEM